MPLSPYRVFRRPVLTEKTTNQRDKYEDRKGHADFVKYTIEVDPKASKSEIRTAVESLFPEAAGHIVKINTIRVRSRSRDSDRNRRSRQFRSGHTATRKKAIITLRDGVKIGQFEGL